MNRVENNNRSQLGENPLPILMRMVMAEHHSTKAVEVFLQQKNWTKTYLINLDDLTYLTLPI